MQSISSGFGQGTKSLRDTRCAEGMSVAASRPHRDRRHYGGECLPDVLM